MDVRDGLFFLMLHTVAIGKQVYGGRSFSAAVFEDPVSSCVSAEWLFSWWSVFLTVSLLQS